MKRCTPSPRQYPKLRHCHGDHKRSRRGPFISPWADAERFERVSVGRSVVAKSLEGGIMKRIAFVLVAGATVGAMVTATAPAMASRLISSSMHSNRPETQEDSTA